MSPWNWLGHSADILQILGTCVTICIATVGWIRRKDLRRWLRRSHFESVGAPFDIPAEQVECIVIPVSRREQPEWILRWLKPSRVSFLYTAQNESRKAAEELAKDKQFAAITFFPSSDEIQRGSYQVNDPDDPQESKRLTGQFLNRFLKEGKRPEQIFVDTTGGKVPMSIGAFQAAEEMGISSIYVVGMDGGLIREPSKQGDGRPVYMSDRSKN